MVADELQVGDLAICDDDAKLKGIVWRIEKIQDAGWGGGKKCYIKAVFGTFGAKKRKPGRWTTQALQKLDIVTLAKEYALFGDFVKREAERLGVDFNDPE